MHAQGAEQIREAALRAQSRQHLPGRHASHAVHLQAAEQVVEAELGVAGLGRQLRLAALLTHSREPAAICLRSAHLPAEHCAPCSVHANVT